MKKLPLLGVALALLALGGCASDTTTFTDDDAQAILFGQLTQAEFSSLGLTPGSNTIATDSVKSYVAGVTDGDSVIDPKECANAVRLLILADQDKNSADTFYALPTLTSGETSISVKGRLFATDGAAQKFVGDFEKANQGCPAFTDTQGNQSIDLTVTVSESADDSKGFRLDTVAGAPDGATTFRTYIVREGNLVIAIQGVTKTDDDANLLVATSAAIYAQLTAGQAE